MLGESRRLLDFYDQLQLGILMLRLWGTATLTEERFRNAADEHLHILEAMQRGDADAALRLLESHIIRVRGSALDRLMRAGTLHSPSSADAAVSPPHRMTEKQHVREGQT